MLCVSLQTSPAFMPWQQETVPCRLKKKPSRRSFCSSATQSLPSPSETLIMCPPFPHGLQPTSPFPRSFPTTQATVQPDYSLLQTDYPPSPLLISKYGLMDLSPPFWSRWCWSVCHMLQMQHILFPVLLHWSNCLQLHS